MDPKYRTLYLLLGFAGLAFLIFHLITTFQDLNPVSVLSITVPDMVFFLLAYKTYPIEKESNG
jgi:hypothetical protein